MSPVESRLCWARSRALWAAHPTPQPTSWYAQLSGMSGEVLAHILFLWLLH